MNVSVIQQLKYFFCKHIRRIGFLFNLHIVSNLQNTLSYLHPLRCSSCAHNLSSICMQRRAWTANAQFLINIISERIRTALSLHLPFMLNRQTWMGFNITFVVLYSIKRSCYPRWLNMRTSFNLSENACVRLIQRKKMFPIILLIFNKWTSSSLTSMYKGHCCACMWFWVHFLKHRQHSVWFIRLHRRIYRV